VVYGETVGVRLEGAGSVTLDDMKIVYMYKAGQKRPSYWSNKCVDTVTLPTTLDPHKQGFLVSSDGFDRASCSGAAVTGGGAR